MLSTKLSTTKILALAVIVRSLPYRPEQGTKYPWNQVSSVAGAFDRRTNRAGRRRPFFLYESSQQRKFRRAPNVRAGLLDGARLSGPRAVGVNLILCWKSMEARSNRASGADDPRVHGTHPSIRQSRRRRHWSG